MFTDLNEKAVDAMSKEEPETALEFLKKADDTLYKLQHNNTREEKDNSQHYLKQN
jgi:hypothetical protein